MSTTTELSNKADQHIIRYLQKHIISYDSNSVNYLESKFRNAFSDFAKYCISAQFESFDTDKYPSDNFNRLLSDAIFRNESLDIKVDVVTVKISSTMKSKTSHTDFYSYRFDDVTRLRKEMITEIINS